MTTQNTSTQVATALRRAARILLLIWAGWWMLFGLASGISGGIGILSTLLQTAVPGLIFLAITLVAWRWEGIGRIVLILLGLLIGLVYLLYVSLPPSMTTSILLTMAMPPLAAGGLFFIRDWVLSRPVE